MRFASAPIHFTARRHMSAESQITVQVVYALSDNQSIITLSVPTGDTAQQAVEKSGVLSKQPEIPWPDSKLGIFGKIVSHSTVLKHGDRIEIYRPLIIDPKESRRQRALLANK